MNIPMEAVAELIAQVGSDVILPFWRKLEPNQVHEKTSPTDLVTEADLRGEEHLTRGLKALLPEALVLGEESYAADPRCVEALQSEQPVWIIDPVDGTLPFASGQPDFGTIVALVQNNVVLAGWIYHPVTKDLLAAERGSGAFFNAQRVRMLPSQPLPKMHGILGMDILPQRFALQAQPDSPDFDPDNYVCCGAPVAVLTDHPFFHRASGRQKHFRAVRKHCLPWDDAAGALAVREAGGEVINWCGERYRPDMFYGGLIAAPSYEDGLALRDWLDKALCSV